MTEIPDRVDRIIRGMSRDYVDDMRRFVFLSSMYNTGVNIMKLERRRKRFPAKHGPIPERFMKHDSEDIERVRLAKIQVLGLLADSTPQTSQ